MKNKTSQIAIGIVCIVLGFMVTLQVKSVYHNTKRTEELKTSDTRLEEANSLKITNDELTARIEELQEEVDFYRENIGTDGEGKILMEQIKKAEMLAGLTDLYGEGVTVVMNDSKAKDENVASENYLIHDDDVRKIINELFAAGAEAVSVNGERIVVTSAIRCVGPVIVINNNRYSPPYEIKAVGDRKTLSAALNQRDGVVDVLKNLWKIEIEITEQEKLEIPRYNGVTSFKYAAEKKK